MVETNGRYVVFGASGGIGSAVVRHLATQGKIVRAVNHSSKNDVPPGVEVVVADATDSTGARRACERATVVYHCAHPSADYAQLPAMTENIVLGVEAAGAKLVLASSAYPYGKVNRPMTEDMPYTAAFPTGEYHTQAAEIVMDAHRNGWVRAAIGRASNYYGPNAGNSYAGDGIFLNALKGKAASVIGDVDQPHTYTFVDDFARALITLGEREEALGEVWHVPSAESITTRHFIELVYHEVGAKPKIMAGSRVPLTFMGLFSSHMRNALQVLYQFEKPFVLDHRKFEKTFGAKATPHRQAIRQTIAWYRQHL
jgi:nucleoside-diphosphate-sugar epimerase